MRPKIDDKRVGREVVQENVTNQAKLNYIHEFFQAERIPGRGSHMYRGKNEMKQSKTQKQIQEDVRRVRVVRNSVAGGKLSDEPDSQ